MKGVRALTSDQEYTGKALQPNTGIPAPGLLLHCNAMQAGAHRKHGCEWYSATEEPVV